MHGNMNVFKLLSRSSKPAQSAPAQKLPSAGAVANPQLFGHDEPIAKPAETKKTKKRKRGGKDAEESTAPLPSDIDFFGALSNHDDAGPSAKSTPKKRKRVEQERKTEDQNGAHEEEEVEPYDEDESKRILRSHKLKITVLEDFVPKEEEVQPEKKKKKRKKEKKEPGKKKEVKKQLFPQPLTSFAQLRSRYGISRRLAENLKEQAYTLPTEVQLGTLPLLLRSRRASDDGQNDLASNASGADLKGDIDLLSVAPTGSGKTVAFLVPIIDALLSEKAEDGEDGIRAIVIAPTRELASQIVNEARKLSKGTGLKAALMKKGMEVVDRSQEEDVEEGAEPADGSEEDESGTDSENEAKAPQQKKRKRGRSEKVKAAILVTTPAALLNALKQNDNTVASLTSVRHLVLDEADVLLDPLFREQTLSIWNACTNPLLRVGLWSATMGSNIEALAISTLNSRWESLSSATTNLPARRPLVRLVVGLKDTAIPNISHQLTYAATEQGKLLGLRQLLHPTAVPANTTGPSLRPPFLVFTQTIPRAIALHSELLYDIPPEAGGSSRIAVLHADLSGTARESIMTQFRRGEIWVLITTDLLARGVDFRGLNGVVNYDVPNSAAAYVHRVGRTGRAGREGGVAVTFYTQEDVPYVKLIANVIRASEKLRGVEESEMSVKQWLLDALPDVSKKDKAELKKKGVGARRTVKTEEGKVVNRISTKSGYERRVENRKRGAKIGSKNREREGRVKKQGGGQGSESEFEGFE